MLLSWHPIAVSIALASPFVSCGWAAEQTCDADGTCSWNTIQDKECQDNHENCAFWARVGECNINPKCTSKLLVIIATELSFLKGFSFILCRYAYVLSKEL